MEVLQRIERMQNELSSKLDMVAQRVPLGDNLRQSGKSDAMIDAEGNEQDASHCEAGHAVTEDATIETPKPMKRQQTWSDENYSRSKTTDLKALHGAMGWRKNMSNVFAVRDDADWLTRFASGPIWAALSVSIIVVNTVFIGVEIQLSTTHHLETALHREGNWKAPPATYDDTLFLLTEKVFLVWMIFEVLVNGYAQKRDFWCGKECRWNAFDLLVIALSICLQVLQFASAGFLRVARLARLGKILRAFRVFKFLRGLRSMMISITGSIVQLFSAMFIMCIFMYTVALIIMQGMASETESGGILEGAINASATKPSSMPMFGAFSDDDTIVQQVYLLYGNIQRTMMTLFMTISGGLEWRQAALPMSKLGWVYGVLWMAYIAFMIFGMLNVLTGIFVDAAFQAMTNDRDNIIQTQLEEKHSLINMIRGIFEDSDVDGSGQVTFLEFQKLLDNPDMVAYLEAMGIDSTEAQGLFRLLDDDGSGVVSIEEFITGFLRLKGSAKAVDMVMLLYENRKISKKLNKIFKEARHANLSLSNMKAAGAKTSFETSV